MHENLTWPQVIALLVGKMVDAKLPMTPRCVTLYAQGDESPEVVSEMEALMRSWAEAWAKSRYLPEDFLPVVGDIADMKEWPSIGLLTGKAYPHAETRRARQVIERGRASQAPALPAANREEALSDFRQRMRGLDPDYDRALARRKREIELAKLEQAAAGNLQEHLT